MAYNGLFIGLTTVDIQYFVDEFPGANEKVKTNPPGIFAGGPAANASVAFSKLNGRANLVTALGANAFTDFLKKDLESNQISLFDLLQNKNSTPVIASVITSVKNGDRTIFSHPPVEKSFSFNAQQIFTKINPDIVLLDGFYPDVAYEFARIARGHGIPVVLDGGSWKPATKNLLQFVDIAICSADFFPPGCVNIHQVFSFLVESGVKKVAVSRGGDSVIYYDNGPAKIDVQQVNCMDTLGAGDFLHGAFCYYYLQNKDFVVALSKASKLASFSCRYKGTREWLKMID